MPSVPSKLSRLQVIAYLLVGEAPPHTNTLPSPSSTPAYALRASVGKVVQADSFGKGSVIPPTCSLDPVPDVGPNAWQPANPTIANDTTSEPTLRAKLRFMVDCGFNITHDYCDISTSTGKSGSSIGRPINDKQ